MSNYSKAIYLRNLIQNGVRTRRTFTGIEKRPLTSKEKARLEKQLDLLIRANYAHPLWESCVIDHRDLGDGKKEFKRTYCRRLHGELEGRKKARV